LRWWRRVGGAEHGVEEVVELLFHVCGAGPGRQSQLNEYDATILLVSEHRADGCRRSGGGIGEHQRADEARPGTLRLRPGHVRLIAGWVKKPDRVSRRCGCAMG
jgi:hypothetical protein